MKKVKISKVCPCGRGLRSHVDLLCAHCRGKDGKRKKEEYYKRLDAFRAQLQMDMFGFIVDDLSEHRTFFVNVRK
ncbi:TPA: hypothetical protein MHT92_02610 [Klebsiella pneumoniae]|jgi:hypothetical protein|nr:hypothetical protein CLI88_27150 [Klebsiella pneumoniae]DAL48328.1 MAG TPA_asm: hypothetical protein [Caudoviricetes sp.]HBX2589268.1 hypothetical protein [Klebsiella pneumoniae]